MQSLKPPLKWAGGKRWLVSHLKTIWEPNATHRYVEPFCGGLAVVLGLQPKHALLNDINSHLINFYRQMQNGLRMRVQMRNDETLFYRHRERFNRLIRRARLTPRKVRSCSITSIERVSMGSVVLIRAVISMCRSERIRRSTTRRIFRVMRVCSDSGSLVIRY